jgi:hypothetical protein
MLRDKRFFSNVVFVVFTTPLVSVRNLNGAQGKARELGKKLF